MKFNYLKIFKVLLILIIYFFIMNYLTIPAMGSGIGIAEMVGLIVTVLSSLYALDLIIKTIKKTENNNENKTN